jgi:hypothetical protein
LRFWDNEVLENLNGVLEQIGEALSSRLKQASAYPLPQGEGEKKSRNSAD